VCVIREHMVIQMFLTQSRLWREWNGLKGLLFLSFVDFFCLLVFNGNFVFLILLLSMEVLDYLFTFKL